MNYTYCLKLFPKIIHQYSYKYKFFDTVGKKLEIVKFILLIFNLLIKGFNFEREDIKSKNLVVRLSEDNEFIESFFLHWNPNHPTQYINFLLGRNYYRYMNLCFTYDTQYKQCFSTKTDFFLLSNGWNN